MTMIADILHPLPQRIRFLDGQLMTSDDLNAIVTQQSAYARLHAIYLHRSWGVAKGFATRQVGPGAVEIAAGFAVLSDGAYIASRHRIVSPVPANRPADHWVLTLRGPRSGVNEGCEPSCDCGNRYRKPNLVWLRANDFDSAADLGLTVAGVDAGRIVGKLNPDVMRFMKQPNDVRLETGSAVEATGRWTPWTSEYFDGAEMHVDTSHYGNAQTPRFFAELYVEPTSQSAEYLSSIASTGQIAAATPGGFTYRLVDIIDPVAEPRSPVLADRLNAARVGLNYWMAEDDGAAPNRFTHLFTGITRRVVTDIGVSR